jgi:nucleoid-associated protein YgaU
VGLIVGLAFILLFGIILSSRAGTQATADLPSGTSQKHQLAVQALGHDVNLFSGQDTLEIGKEGDGGTEVAADTPLPRDEPLRAPDDLKPSEPATPRTEEEGRLAFIPARVETPGREFERPPLARDPEDAGVKDPGPKDSTGNVVIGKDKSGDAAPKTYTVAKGDTLGIISKKMYGSDAERTWRRLYEANKKTVKDANHLVVGQVLVVPVIPGLPAAPKKGAEPPARGDLDTLARTPSAAPAKAPATNAIDPATGPSADPVAKAPADAPSKPTLKTSLTRASRDGIPRVNADEVGRMFGARSDLAESPVVVPQMYVIQPGDTYSRIGSRVYGDSKYGKLLLLKNQHLAPDETKLKVGQKILLLDGVESNRTM